MLYPFVSWESIITNPNDKRGSKINMCRQDYSPKIRKKSLLCMHHSLSQHFTAVPIK
jgi:hypothetical protein